MHRLFRREKDPKKQKNVAKGGEKPTRKPSTSSTISSPTHHIVLHGDDKKHHSNYVASRVPEANSNSLSPSASSQDVKQKGNISRIDSRTKVAAHKAFYEDLSLRTISPGSQSPRRLLSSPEKKKPDNEDLNDGNISSRSNTVSSGRIAVSVTSPTSYGNRTPVSRVGGDYMSSSSPSIKRHSILMEGSGHATTEIGKEKAFEGIDLLLPPLQTSAVRLREVEAKRNPQGGGFGFILRKSYLPVPEEPDKTKLVHLIEPRTDYYGPLMTGDRIIEVNGEVVEDAPHEMVVEMIKASGDSVDLKVASMPELMELNNRGALDDPFDRNKPSRKSGKAKQGTG